ncbi:MAG: hypothetical protein CEN87_117 [Parcubacteria group bacterium Licking1014_1]|nr:MAG: hypothetical protein CEN87_117 [Parcubacteria group bacterium Licking1014_1]
MIYFLYGQDLYRTKQKLEEIIVHYKEVHKSGLNLTYIDAEENDFKDLMDSFKVVSMFSEKKLIILKNIFSVKTFQEEFSKETKTLKDSKDIIVVFEKDKVDQRTKFFEELKKEAKCQEFKLLDNKGLKIWLKKEEEKHGAKIDPEAENLLLTFAGNDLWQLSNEIKKLADFKAGKLIKKEDIYLLVRPKIGTDIFKTIDALASKNKKLALGFLHKHLENGENPLYLLSMIAYQFRNLLIIKEMIDKGMPYAIIQKKSGLKPFVVNKTYYLCSQFSFQDLKKIYQKIFQADLDIKTGKVESETALDLLVSEI